MKRIYLLCALSLSLLLFSGCAKQTEQMSYIGAENAKQLALDAAGLTAADSITTDLSTRDGLDYYQVVFTADGQDYQYDIDALTGTIIEAHSPIVNEPDAGTPAAPELPVSASEAGGSSTHAGDMITAGDAETAALSHAGLTSDQVTFIKSELGYERGLQVYEVEFYTQDRTEYDYEIDAYSGEVISFDYEAKDYASASSGTAISADEAKEIALAQVPGAASSDLQAFKADYDDGRIEYEGTILYNGMEYEFEIDGYSGAVRSWEAEPSRR